MGFISDKEITEEDVKHIANLAKIDLDEVEIKKFKKQFNDILDYFNKIDEAETEGVEPTYHGLNLKNVTREDEVKDELSQKEALENANESEDGFFKSPRVKE
ncbi:MAG: Asp-tRNAAsn/Glu-tRNAGln amidotransferase C subunit, GatC [Candidatus Methanohalarchaeum thermophilum]|uniref:Aspartyl/glutamyl-tRNA(Asn/Gln) amidotransferase subunit C n=1 Tax=Methanohalarchaeum thermophilum TaxID=1903181 RepID=A0A1Q6DW58_METT1|nr:MAG: Asp-tRNAAsn/Glu-tRNAGln amidotransferase C subunit, GatC [Candidatus Methanohalarchaeum thermophilum]